MKVMRMAKHMSDLLLNSDVAKKLGMQGMCYVRDNLTLDSHIRQLTKIIESAVNN
jgi:hypothetical protein